MTTHPKRQQKASMRKAGWAGTVRKRVFDGTVEGLKKSFLRNSPIPRDYASHRILVLRGPKRWIRYFVWVEPTRRRLAAGLYVPKGKYGDAVNVELTKRGHALGKKLGGTIRQHKPVQREYRHFVERDQSFAAYSLDDAVEWCVRRLSAAHEFVTASAVLLDSKKLQAAMLAPIANDDEFFASVEALVEGRQLSPPAGNKNPHRSKSSDGWRFIRDPAVAAYARQRADGKCDRCSGNAPFHTARGNPFLEVHHLTRLADGGPDVWQNTVAVCPNCHRLLHFGPDPDREQQKLRSRLLAGSLHRGCPLPAAK